MSKYYSDFILLKKCSKKRRFLINKMKHKRNKIIKKIKLGIRMYLIIFNTLKLDILLINNKNLKKNQAFVLMT